MSSQTKSKREPSEPPYVGWRGELIAKLALTRAGLVVQDGPVPQPFDLLASTPDGLYFLVEVNAYSSMHRGRQPVFDPSGKQGRWPVGAPILRAAARANVPVVLFVVDADREFGHYARVDRLPRPGQGERSAFVPLVADRDLSPHALADLILELHEDRAASRRPA